MSRNKLEIIIKDTHRGLWYEDGVLTKVLEAGRYKIPLKRLLFFRPEPLIQVELVDMRERDLTIKGQEILTSDKVALRVSIVVRFRVVDPKLALHAVEKYEDRLYSDVQLAARRSLASMTLEEILTNRNRLSELKWSGRRAPFAIHGRSSKPGCVVRYHTKVPTASRSRTDVTSFPRCRMLNV